MSQKMHPCPQCLEYPLLGELNHTSIRLLTFLLGFLTVFLTVLFLWIYFHCLLSVAASNFLSETSLELFFYPLLGCSTPNFYLCLGDSLTNPMSITAFFHSCDNLMITQSFVMRLSPSTGQAPCGIWTGILLIWLQCLNPLGYSLLISLFVNKKSSHIYPCGHQLPLCCHSPQKPFREKLITYSFTAWIFSKNDLLCILKFVFTVCLIMLIWDNKWILRNNFFGTQYSQVYHSKYFIYITIQCNEKKILHLSF